MTYEKAKIILCVLMCIPVLWLSLYMLISVHNVNVKVQKRESAKRKKEIEAIKNRELQESRYQRFSEEYSKRRDRRSGQ